MVSAMINNRPDGADNVIGLDGNLIIKDVGELYFGLTGTQLQQFFQRIKIHQEILSDSFSYFITCNGSMS